MRSSIGGSIGALVAAVLAAWPCGATAEPPRRPEALLLVDGGARLLAANRGTGTISVVDLAGRRVEGEFPIGRGPVDLRATTDEGVWLAVDREAGEVVLLVRRDGAVRRAGSVVVAADPVRAAVFGDGRRALILSRGSRAATFVAWDGAEGPRVVAKVDLPFSPREAAALPGDGPASMVVADAFGGRLALIDLEAKACRKVWTLPDHNLRGLAIAPDGRSLAILAQNATPTARTSRDDVEWGLLVRSWIRLLRVDDLRSEGTTDESLLANSRTVALSGVGKGSADPSALAFGPRGEVVVAMTGVDEVASALALGEAYERLKTGRGPSALATSPDAATAYTADAFDDAITVLDLEAGRIVATIALSADAGPDGRRKPATLLEEGEALFRDARLSEDGWMSCQTCHTDGHTASVLIDTRGDSSYGAAKRTPTLRGVADTGPWGWLGNMQRLEDQIHLSLTTTMRGHEPRPRQVEALAAFLRTFDPPAPETPTDEKAVARGRAIFETERCDACHAAPTYTTPRTYDVGLEDAVGNRDFNPPSLLGVGRRPALLHDASIPTLPDLFRQAHHPDGAPRPTTRSPI
ncbi:cytochrome c peroxidase [Planctomyces sp. SH-PL62]|uniref:cytochrome c peroxidase n=1 Tax=Planctomyces sp. SH-PL62 TaxID=1636152 RepID=UPI00078E863E|nr:cytochrome c peroxidase [Planctomyces sp. SH-PL62]AMV40753.1 Di-heme cytochrome c peroxidase [Planctomyces sp. SH-PL62]